MSFQTDFIKAEPTIPESAPQQPALLVAFFHRCDACGERFLLQDDLIEHARCHKASQTVACQRRPARCTSDSQLTQNTKRHHVAPQGRRKVGPIQARCHLRCEDCGIDSFPSYSFFRDHHVYHHVVTRRQPRVILERPAAATLKLTLRRSSQEQHGQPTQFEVIPSDGQQPGMDGSSEATMTPSVDVAAPVGRLDGCQPSADVTPAPRHQQYQSENGHQTQQADNGLEPDDGLDPEAGEDPEDEMSPGVGLDSEGSLEHPEGGPEPDDGLGPGDGSDHPEDEFDDEDGLEQPGDGFDDGHGQEQSGDGFEDGDGLEQPGDGFDDGDGLEHPEDGLEDRDGLEHSKDGLEYGDGLKHSEEGLGPGESLEQPEDGIADGDGLEQPEDGLAHGDGLEQPDDGLEPDDDLEPGDELEPQDSDADPGADESDSHHWSELDPDSLVAGPEPGGRSPHHDSLHGSADSLSGEQPAGGAFSVYDEGGDMRSGECDGAEATAGGVTAHVLPDGDEQDDVLRLLDSLNRDGAGAAATAAPLPRLLAVAPVSSPVAPTRLTASAPPPPPSSSSSPTPPRSVTSDPGTTDGEMAAPSLQDLLPPAADQGDQGDQADQQDGQPLIRMAAIAANIPDERSFRHEAPPTPAPPPLLQPRPDGMAGRPVGQPPTSIPQLTPAARPALPLTGNAISCFVCHIPLPDVRSLQEHLLMHQSSMQCSMCPFKASNVGELKAHNVTFHGKMQTGAIGRPPNSNMSTHMALRPGLSVQAQRFPHIRRGRPPLDPGRMAHLQMNGLRGGLSGRGGMLTRPGHPMAAQSGGRVSVIAAGQKRPLPTLLSHDPSKRPRPGIPIQPDKSDCQVIAVQRRQQGVPVIHNVEGSAHSGSGTIRLSDSITMTVQGGHPAAAAAPAAGSDVASILANRGISITPASCAPSSSAATAPLSLPNLPAGISLTPAVGGSDGFAVPRPPGSVHQTAVSRPARPPTVDLTTDVPVRGHLSCRYCERQLPTAAALAHHEKAHVSAGPSHNLRCRVCGIVMQSLALLQQHMQQRHGSTLPPAAGRPVSGLAELVVPVFDLSQVSRSQLEALGVRGFLPVSQVNQRQGQLGLPIISLQGLGKTGPSPRPVAFFNLGPVRPIR